jgi:hypothetical protein
MNFKIEERNALHKVQKQHPLRDQSRGPKIFSPSRSHNRISFSSKNRFIPPYVNESEIENDDRVPDAPVLSCCCRGGGGERATNSLLHSSFCQSATDCQGGGGGCIKESLALLLLLQKL